jgi:hypothetical protein
MIINVKIHWIPNKLFYFVSGLLCTSDTHASPPMIRTSTSSKMQGDRILSCSGYYREQVMLVEAP